MSIIIEGKKIALKLNNILKDSINELVEKGNRRPMLVAIQVGNNPASSIYIRNKKNACEKVGIDFRHEVYNEEISQEELIEKINKLNNDLNCDGILVQLPLPKTIDDNKIVNTIDITKDADGFCPATIGNVMFNKSDIYPGTPKGIIRLLKEYNINVEGKNVVVVGRSSIVGKPVAAMLINLSATVTICHSKTRDLKAITRNADVVISAIGKAKFITREFVNSDAVIIDVGINKTESGFCGDTDFENLNGYVRAITPVPGGVGPMTVSSLLDNVYRLYLKKIGTL